VQIVLLLQDWQFEGQITLHTPFERLYPAKHAVQDVADLHVLHEDGHFVQPVDDM